MNTSQGRLFYAAGLDNSQLRADAAESRNILHSIGQTARQEGGAIDEIFGKMKRTAGQFFAMEKAKEFAKEIVSLRGEIQSLEISFETLLGSKRKADGLFGELRSFAVQTPMQLKDLAAGAQTMLGFNIEAEKVMPMLRAIGDISMGDAQKFNSLSLAFSQASASGKLMGQDLMQMINAGFNPLAVISEKTGKSINELKEDMEKGKITVRMMEEAFIAATSEGGKFYQMLEKQSHGINGAVAYLQGAYDDFLNDLGTASEEAIVGTINVTANLIKHYEQVAEVLGVIIGMYGSYHAALITEAALKNSLGAQLAIRYEAELAALTSLLPAQEQSLNQDIREALAKKQITAAMAEKLVAMREETASYIESLAAAKAAASAEAQLARDKYRAALQQSIAAKAAVAAKREELVASGEICGAYVSENAAREMQAVKTQAQAAAETAATAKKEYSVAVSKKKAAAQALETAQTQADTVAQNVNTGSTSMLTLAKGKLTDAVKKAYAAIAAHPYALAAAAAFALGYALYKGITYQSDMEKGALKLKDVLSSTSVEVNKETSELNYLSDKLNNAKKGSEQWQNVKDEIVRKYGQYFSGLDAEIQRVGNLSTSYDTLTTAIKKAAAARALDAWEKDNPLDVDDDLKTIQKMLAGNDVKFMNPGGTTGKGALHKATQDVYMAQISDAVLSQDYSKLSPQVRYFLENNWKLTHNGHFGRITGTSIMYGAGNKAGQYNAGKDAIYSRYGIPDSDSKPAATDDKTYQQALAEQRKLLAENEKKLEKAKKSGTQKEVKTLMDENDAIKKRLKEDYGVDVKSDERKGTAAAKAAARAEIKAENVQSDNADILAKEAAERLKQAEEYARKLADAAREDEFEIEQAKIDAMQEGADKELRQNKLNYDRRLETMRIKERELLDEAAKDKLRTEEDEEPMKFKKTDRNGKIEDDPGKRDERLREIRAQITVENLDSTQQAQLKEMAELATEAYSKANADTLKKMLSEVKSYEQQRTRISSDYTKKRMELYEKNEKGEVRKDEVGNPTFRKGASERNIEEINRAEEEALKALDEQFAQREEDYKAWCAMIGSLSLKQLEKVLEDAKRKLAELENDKGVDPAALARARAEVNKAVDAVKSKRATDKYSLDSKQLKNWETLYQTLTDVEKEFESIGDTAGGVVGEIMKQCGAFASSTMTMINSIMQLANWSATATKLTAAGVSASMQTMEKASVILTAISAAMQIAMQIASLFNKDARKQEEIEGLQARIDELQWGLDNRETGKIQQEYGTAIERINKALADSRRELAEGTTGWERFVKLSQKASDNTELMKGAAERLAKAYVNVAYSAGKAFGEAKYDEAQDKLRNLAEQQILIKEQIDAEASKKKSDSGAIKEWEQKIEELGAQSIRLINDMVEEIIGDTSTGIAEQLADAFFEAFQAGEDAAEAWGDKVNDIVADVMKRMLISKFLEEPLGQIFDKYKAKWFKDGEFQGLDSVINSMEGFASDLNSVGADFAEIWENLPDSVKSMFKITDDAAREASQKGIATASQESVDELNGRATAIQGHTFSIMENMKLLLSTTQSILKCVMSIEDETEGFKDRLSRMESNLKEANDNIGDIVSKGIRLKN